MLVDGENSGEVFIVPQDGWAYYWYSTTARAEKNSSEDRTINAVAQIVFLFEQQCVVALFE